MDADILKKKYDRLFDLVRKMRGIQKEYFNYRAKSDLEIAKRWERQVDQYIKDELKARDSKQGEIFK